MHQRPNQLFLTGHGGSLEAGLRAIQAPLLLIASANAKSQIKDGSGPELGRL